MKAKSRTSRKDNNSNKHIIGDTKHKKNEKKILKNGKINDLKNKNKLTTISCDRKVDDTNKDLILRHFARDFCSSINNKVTNSYDTKTMRNEAIKKQPPLFSNTFDHSDLEEENEDYNSDENMVINIDDSSNFTYSSTNRSDNCSWTTSVGASNQEFETYRIGGNQHSFFILSYIKQHPFINLDKFYKLQEFK